MAKIEASTVINRPLEEVFAFVSDVNNVPQWQSSVLEARTVTPGETGVGTVQEYKIQVMGKQIETSGEITAYEPNRHFAWKSIKGPFPMSGETTFEETTDGVRVTDSIEVEPGGFFKLATPLLVKQQKSDMEKDLAKLKELLEK